MRTVFKKKTSLKESFSSFLIGNSAKNKSSIGLACTVGLILSSAINVLQLSLPLFSMQIFDRVLPSGSFPTLVSLLSIVIIVILCTIGLEASRAVLLVRIGNRFALNYQANAVKGTVLGMDASPNKLRSLETIRRFSASPTSAALFDAPWYFVFLFVIFSLHPILGWLTVAASTLVVLVAVASYVLNGNARREAAATANDGQALVEKIVEDGRLVRVLGLQRHLSKRLEHLLRKATAASSSAMESQAWAEAAGRGVRNAIQAVAMATAAALVLSHDVQVGAIVATSMLFARAIAPIERLCANIPAILQFARAVHDIQDLRKPSSDHEKMRLAPLIGNLTVEHLSYTAFGRSRPVLKGLSFSVAAGEVVAVVGPEGAGKSSLAHLLVGVLRPQAGTVRLDGSNILDFEAAELSRQVGFLPESASLGSGSVAQIIGRGGDADHASILAAAELAGAHQAIQNLPQGYQTFVGVGHTLLSAGQRQRVALARAFYGSPRFIVLDEPTVHLDDRGESQVIAAIQELSRGGSTVIVISRLPGLLHVIDRFIMLQEGTIRLHGTQEGMQAVLKPRLAAARLAGKE